jgi:SAM-dependent methyltransferase
MSNVSSPITGGPSLVLSAMKIRDICRLYKRRFAIDVSHYFKGIDQIQFRECVDSGVRFFYPFRPGDSAFYSTLSKDNLWYYAEDKEEYIRARAWLTRVDSVLDVGCGVGKFADSVPDVRFTGLELSESAAALGREAGRMVVQAPLRDYARHHADAYGAVTAFQVLEHVVDPVEFLQGMISCVRPGGLVIVSVPAEDGALGACVNDALNLPPHHMTRWTDRALTFVMTMMGLKEVELHHLSLDPGHQSEAVAQFLARVIVGSGFQNRLVCAGLVERILFAILRRVARRARRDPTVRFWWGQTVIAIGRKPG